MKIDLCKIFGVEEGEEFKIEYRNHDKLTYKVEGNTLMFKGGLYNNYTYSHFFVNELTEVKKIIKLPKKKEFTDDELAIMRSLPKEYKWMARDCTKEIFGYEEKPSKSEGNWYRPYNGRYCILSAFNHIFKEITTEDEEPVFIDDYVERGVE